jgi:SAM-dependent methyltransferase
LLFLLVTTFVVAISVLAAVVYPGELSWLGPRWTAYLYNKAAANYETKWSRHNYVPYDDLIREAVVTVRHKQRDEPLRIVDLCCGTGRATFRVLENLTDTASVDCVDNSAAMLAILSEKLPNFSTPVDVRLHCEDVTAWLARAKEPYHLAVFMECSEFLPDFDAVVKTLSTRLHPGALVVTTRPEGLFSWFFPGRSQRWRAYSALFSRYGFSLHSDERWRARYRLVSWTFNHNII